MKKLAIVTTHPIQYYAPIFKFLAKRKIINVKVFYTWGEAALVKYDPGFNKEVAWDIPLLEGYEFEWAVNVATKPGSHHRKGIITPGLIEQVKAYNADAVLVIGWAYDSHIKIISHFKNKIPVYFRGDSTLLDEQKGLKAIFKTIFLKWIYSHIDYAFYTGTNNKAYYKKYGLTDKQLIFAPHAVDNERFAAKRQDEAITLRKKMGIAVDDILILFAGKFEDKKAPLLLLDAFLSLRIAECHLLFVGNGALGPKLKLKAAQNPSVYFMDFVNQSYMPVVYQACNVFCLPSNGPAESWGLAVNEAMACSKAVLVSNKCGCAIDLVKPKNGIIFNSGNMEDLSLGLKTLVTDKSTLAEAGRQSALIIKDWNYTRIADVIEQQLLNEKKRQN